MVTLTTVGLYALCFLFSISLPHFSCNCSKSGIGRARVCRADLALDKNLETAETLVNWTTLL